MRRREFITLLGGAAAWPLASSAAPVGPIPRVGVIDDGPNWDYFRQGLREFGYVVGQNLAIERLSAAEVRLGSFTSFQARSRHDRFTPMNGPAVIGSSGSCQELP